MSTRAGTSAATRSAAPRAIGDPVVAATIDAAVGRGRPDARMAISANAAVDRSRIWDTSSWPAGDCRNAWPSCVPSSRCRLPSAGWSAAPSLGSRVRAVASTPGSPGRCSVAAESRAETSTGAPAPASSDAVSVVGSRPFALNDSRSGPAALITGTRASSSAAPGRRRRMISASCSSSYSAA
jgi:hypothetical protein